MKIESAIARNQRLLREHAAQQQAEQRTNARLNRVKTGTVVCIFLLFLAALGLAFVPSLEQLPRSAAMRQTVELLAIVLAGLWWWL